MASSAVPAKLRDAVWQRDKGICGICHEPVDPLEWNADHILPYFLGGPTEVANLRVTHPRCNRARARRMTDEEIDDAIGEWTERELRAITPTWEAFYAAHINLPPIVTDGEWTCPCQMCLDWRAAVDWAGA